MALGEKVGWPLFEDERVVSRGVTVPMKDTLDTSVNVDRAEIVGI